MHDGLIVECPTAAPSSIHEICSPHIIRTHTQPALLTLVVHDAHAHDLHAIGRGRAHPTVSTIMLCVRSQQTHSRAAALFVLRLGTAVRGLLLLRATGRLSSSCLRGARGISCVCTVHGGLTGARCVCVCASVCVPLSESETPMHKRCCLPPAQIGGPTSICTPSRSCCASSRNLQLHIVVSLGAVAALAALQMLGKSTVDKLRRKTTCICTCACIQQQQREGQQHCVREGQQREGGSSIRCSSIRVSSMRGSSIA
jgi:hypothetical protein